MMSGAPPVIRLASERVGVPAVHPAGGTSNQWNLDFQYEGLEVSWFVDGSDYTIGLPVESRVAFCLGDCEPPFTVAIAGIDSAPAYALPPEAQHGEEPRDWLRSEQGVSWVKQLNLGPSENVVCTTGWLEAKLRARDPITDVARVFSMLDSVFTLPQGKRDREGGSDLSAMTELSPELRDFLATFADLLQPDDVVRSAALRQTDRHRIVLLLQRGRPLLSEINRHLDQLEATGELSEHQQELTSLLHSAGQVIVEAELSLQHA